MNLCVVTSFLLAFGAVFLLQGTPSDASSSSRGPLIWADEFDGGSINLGNWQHEIWGPGTVNNELQSYTDSSANSYIEDGNLVLRAIPDGNGGYTSARLISRYRFDFKYGYAEIRASLPNAEGFWPALWMLPTDNVYGGWPNSGEIDIMEHVSCDQGVVHATTHTELFNWMTGNQPTAQVNIGAGEVQNFHVYQVEWTENSLKVGLDGNFYFETYKDPSLGSGQWPFDQLFFFIFNIAVGGDWGGYCLNGQKPQFPDDGVGNVMKVDYIRVYSL